MVILEILIEQEGLFHYSVQEAKYACWPVPLFSCAVRMIEYEGGRLLSRDQATTTHYKILSKSMLETGYGRLTGKDCMQARSQR